IREPPLTASCKRRGNLARFVPPRRIQQRLATRLSPLVVCPLGLGPPVPDTILAGSRRRLLPCPLLLHPPKVDDLAHRAILLTRDHTRNREGNPWAARSI